MFNKFTNVIRRLNGQLLFCKLEFLKLVGNYRDANFPDAEIVRSEERGGLEPRTGPGGVPEQRHFGDQVKYVIVYLML